jgi:hypothetical protein
MNFVRKIDAEKVGRYEYVVMDPILGAFYHVKNGFTRLYFRKVSSTSLRRILSFKHNLLGVQHSNHQCA